MCKKPDLALVDFEPKSVLRLPETRVERPRFPVIDFHTHLSWSPSLGTLDPERGASPILLASPEELLPVMDRKGVRSMVNLTGGCGKVLRETLNHFSRYPDRFIVFCEPAWSRVSQAGFPLYQADQIAHSYEAGARGLKILKVLGLVLRQSVVSGPLIQVDDPRFDPMWEAAGARGMPVLIHVSDPEAFFLPVDRFNERYEELWAHPDWSVCDPAFPSNVELHEARNRVIERHPGTRFVLAHLGNAENLGWVSEWMDRYPNIWVDISARIGELGRQPRAAGRFFDKYQDRIVFGTDAIPNGEDYPQQVFGNALYEIYYRFLESEDEYFDYSPARVPPQGRWRIYGLGLSENILKKVYFENAARLLGLLT